MAIKIKQMKQFLLFHARWKSFSQKLKMGQADMLNLACIRSIFPDFLQFSYLEKGLQAQRQDNGTALKC